MSDPLLLIVAPNGARKTKSDHPQVPIGPDEIAATAKACCDAGAAMIHLHVRDRDGKHTLDVEAYRAATAAIRQAIGDRLVVQATTEAVGIYAPAQQMAMVRGLKPEAVSLSIRELVPDAAAEPAAADFFGWLAREHIAPHYILYSADEVTRLRDLCRRGIVPQSRPFALYVLGRYTAGQRSEPADLLPFLAAAASDALWSVCAFGPRESACIVAAAALGGHVRVGFENNLNLADGRVAPDNAALVAQAARAAPLVGRRIADADTARAMLAGLR